MSDLTSILMGAQNPDPAVRTSAEQQLKNAENTNLPEFFGALATQLSTESVDITARQLAGIHFKNLLVAREGALQVAKHEKWKTMDANTRAQIKTLLLTALCSPEKEARHTAAQAASEVAAIEMPYFEWPDFPTSLRDFVAGTQPDGVKTASLMCLGFTCERIALIDGAPDLLPETTDIMLTTIVDGIRSDRPDHVRLEAAKALRNSLLFSKKNMEQKNERDMIVKTICEATQSQDANVRSAAYECISQIVFLYYEKLQDYMETFVKLTFAAIQTDQEPVAMQAVEVWNTLCETEMDLIDEAADLAERDLQPKIPCVRYVEGALTMLGPVLLETLTKQDEDADLDDEAMNLSMAGANCLRLVAQTVEDKVVPIVMPFVTANIQNQEWRLREAATMAFNCILDGPRETLGQYVNQSIPVLLQALNDANEMVRDTTANTIGVICELHVRAVPEQAFPTLVQSLIAKLGESPRVVRQAAFAIHYLGAAFATDESAARSGTNALSGYMPALLQSLLAVVDREDGEEFSLREVAFQSIGVLIQYSAPDCIPLLVQLLPVMVERLDKSFSIAVMSNDDREKRDALQGGLCGILQTLFIKLDKSHVAQYADNIMTNLLKVLQIKDASSHEEAFSAMGSLADLLEMEFEKYMAALEPFLMNGLRSFEAFRVCTVAVGLVGDISRAIENRLLPFCDEIMNCLLVLLQNQELHRSVKPPVLSCIGDIALSINGEFAKYAQVSMSMLIQASQTRAPDDDEDLIEYVNTLREGVLEAYTGIFQGLQDGNRLDVLLPTLESILAFLELIASDENRDFEVLSKAVGLLGDIAQAVGPQIKEQMSKPYVEYLISCAQSTGDSTIMGTAHYAREAISKALQL